MKIAIQGHPTRGKEVIQILESLGGINRMHHSGRFVNYFYYISSDDNTISWTCIRFTYFRVCTLEEFLFKIGDKVTFKDDNHPYTIKSFGIWSDGDIVYQFAENDLHYSVSALKHYKEMKEERNITLTLEKAKEWYEKGGELKEIALQAFKESELNPKRWIDLGLPSGTLWCDTNEEGYFSWNAMKESFNEENLPKLTDFAELYDYCKWEWDDEKKGMWVTGSNGNCIFLSAMGYRTSISNSLEFVDNIGQYWSISPGGYGAFYLAFNYCNDVYLSSDNHKFNCSICLIKRK